MAIHQGVDVTGDVMFTSRMVKCFIVLAVLFLLGCSENPGYGVRIYVEKNSGMSKRDIHFITDIMKLRSFETIMIKDDGLWSVASYKIMLEDERFNAFGRKYIGLVIESWCAPKVSSDEKSTCKVEVRIGNYWEGRNPTLKAEIDMVADQIINNLSNKFNKSELRVKRMYISPM